MTGTKLPFLLRSAKKSRPLAAGLGRVRRAVDEAGGVDAHRRLVGDARVAGERDRGLVFGLQEVGPVGRRVLHDVGVHREGQHAVIVADPIAVGVLGRIGNRRPGRDLVGRQQAVGLGGGAERQADVDHVGRLRALVVLVGLDRLDFVARTAVGVELVDGEAVLRLEAVDHGAVAAPVARQRDDRELTLFLRGGDQIVHGRGERGRRRIRAAIPRRSKRTASCDNPSKLCSLRIPNCARASANFTR